MWQKMKNMMTPRWLIGLSASAGAKNTSGKVGNLSRHHNKSVFEQELAEQKYSERNMKNKWNKYHEVIIGLGSY